MQPPFPVARNALSQREIRLPSIRCLSSCCLKRTDYSTGFCIFAAEMKNILPTLCLLVNLVLLCACSHDMAEEKDAPSPARTSFHKLAAEMISRGAPFDSIIAMQQKAVDELRRGMSEENPVDVLQKMGYLYCRAGRYELGADYLLEAVDSIGSLPPGEESLETQMWKERSDSARKIIVLQWLAIVLAVILASLIIGYALKKLRDARRSKELIHTRLLSMFAHQKEVNATIETLNSRIEQLNKEIEGRNDAENIQKLIAGMPSCLLSDSQEALFRRYFTQIYPHFIPDLRHDYPSITPNDELISMLIYMKYGSEEIALSLGISRQSVNTARYRLRKKLNLDKETDLDTFLTSRKG